MFSRNPWDLSEDRRRCGTGQAAGRVERVDAEELVDEAAGDTKHSRAAVVALRVELEGPFLGVRVALPSGAADVTRGLSSARSLLSLRR